MEFLSGVKGILAGSSLEPQNHGDTELMGSGCKSMIRQEISSFRRKEQIIGIAENMKRLAQEIVVFYESRISTVGMIIDDTHQLLEDFKTKRNEMSTELKETLAREGSLRKKDFDNMMKDILSRQDEREKEVRDFLKTFLEEQKEMAETIKKNLADGEKVRIDDFKKMLQDIQKRQRARENEVSAMLKEFQKEYKEMAESLHSLLYKGEAIRIKDFKEMVKNIRARQMQRAKEVRVRLDEFGREREDMASQWHKLTVVMAKKRADRLKGESKEREEVAKVLF